MGLFSKPEKKFHVVRIGYLPIYFTNESEALELYQLLSRAISRVNVESRMIDKGEDFKGYEHLHYLTRAQNIQLETEEVHIHTIEEVERKAAEVKAAKEAYEKKHARKKKK